MSRQIFSLLGPCVAGAAEHIDDTDTRTQIAADFFHFTHDLADQDAYLFAPPPKGEHPPAQIEVQTQTQAGC